jgi:hypothetical protein
VTNRKIPASFENRTPVVQLMSGKFKIGQNSRSGFNRPGQLHLHVGSGFFLFVINRGKARVRRGRATGDRSPLHLLLVVWESRGQEQY